MPDNPVLEEALKIASKKAYKPKHASLSYMLLSSDLTEDQAKALIENKGWRYTNWMKISLVAPKDWAPNS